jgi:hypothetical protein
MARLRSPWIAVVMLLLAGLACSVGTMPPAAPAPAGQPQVVRVRLEIPAW